jgi:predicted 3-demethylubiquinone-9 3-methyltransferase (glyoxalase superfamily)
MHPLKTFLWFDDQAEEAVTHYTGIFKNAKVYEVARYGESGPGLAGTVMTIEFEINGQRFVALNGGPVFSFNPSISFVVDCDTQEEIDYYWEKLGEGGEYSQCGWLMDKFGLSWQVVPVALYELTGGPDPEAAQRATEAMLKMSKLEIAGLRAAYEQG